MNIFDAIKQKIATLPDVRYTESPGSITIQPMDDSGFEVVLVSSDDGYRVYFDGWHEEFTTDEEALKCVAFGLSGRCRLRVTLFGRTPVRWQLEFFENNHWQYDSEVGLFFIPFWRRRSVIYRQNHFQ
ncbi:hypothetical protein K2Y11_14475 [bacterium]|nr:hypothetical protein [bacterium]